MLIPRRLRLKKTCHLRECGGPHEGQPLGRRGRRGRRRRCCHCSRRRRHRSFRDRRCLEVVDQLRHDIPLSFLAQEAEVRKDRQWHLAHHATRKYAFSGMPRVQPLTAIGRNLSHRGGEHSLYCKSHNAPLTSTHFQHKKRGLCSSASYLLSFLHPRPLASCFTHRLRNRRLCSS